MNNYVLIKTILIVGLLCIAGCEDSRMADDDAGRDAGARADAGPMPDGATPPDGGMTPDAAVADAGGDAGAGCPDPYVGDLLRGETSSAIFYEKSDGRRSVFPADREFMTWFADFSRVLNVTDEELSGIPLTPPNVTIRPGTWLVKITTDPRTYAVTPCRTVREIESELLAIQLYGADWATRVVDIPDAFFADYLVGDPITTAVHPTGQLVRYAGNTDVYLMENGRKRLVSSRAFADSNFRTEFVIETTIDYPDGEPYDCAEPLYQEVVCVTCGCPEP